VKISNETNKKIFTEIKNRLMPDLKKVIAKVLGIHILSALLTLTVCPQMGFSLIENKINLMDFFMKLGPHFCDFACGTFFTSVSVGFIYLVLSKDEFRFLRYHPWLMVSTMILTSMGFLLMLNPHLFVQFTFLWLTGAIIGVLGSMEIGFRLSKGVL
jgi:hypothetical protein